MKGVPGNSAFDTWMGRTWIQAVNGGSTPNTSTADYIGSVLGPYDGTTTPTQT